MKYADWSNQNGVLSTQIIQAARSEGFGGIVINTYGPNAVAELTLAQQERLETAAYVYLNFPGGQFYSGISAHNQVTTAIDKMEVSGVIGGWIGLDCEDPGNNLGIRDTIAFIQEAADACIARRYSRIYTAEGWWRQYTKNTYQFANYPLWVALPQPEGTPPPTTMTLPHPFGGWTEAAMIQYDFHSHIGSIEVDADITPDAVGTGDEDSMVDRHLVEGSQDIGILNAVAAKALGDLAAGNQSQGVSAYVRYGPSVDLPIGEQELIIRVPFNTFPAGLGV